MNNDSRLLYSRDTPSPDDIMRPVRPGRLQAVMRKWILLVPLATAMVGTGLVSNMTQGGDDYVVLLPPVFFIGALVVTAAMMHQRRMLDTAVKLAERLHEANTHLEILHQLARELNQSLDPEQVAQTVLQHLLRAIGADAGALWLHTDQVIPWAMGAHFTMERAPSSRKRGLGTRLAALGFETEVLREAPHNWEEQMLTGEEGDACPEGRHFHSVLSDAPSCPQLGQVFGRHHSAVSLPIRWKGELVGSMMIARRGGLTRDQVLLLIDAALIAGPALQNALAYRIIAERAELDGLTRLYNHRVLQERLSYEVARVQRLLHRDPQNKLAVATLDINDFKLFNDTYGHATGDEVLKTVAECLRQTLRGTDVVGRYGGDEFVVLLPDTGSEGAEILCQRAVDAVGGRPFLAPDGLPISIGMSWGVAQMPDDAQSAVDLLRVSDARLYLNKGRSKSGTGGPAGPGVGAKPDWKAVGVLDALITAIDNKDHFTRRHCEKVWCYASLLAQELKAAPDMVQGVQIASLVQDVGKIIVPDGVLRKPGRLNADETAIMQQHPVFGAMLVKDVPQLELVLQAVRCHHEQFDGTGYPGKLAGADIPYIARILGVADSFAAMTSDRPQRKALSQTEAMKVLKDESGKHYDPEITQALERVLHRNGLSGHLTIESLFDEVAHLAPPATPETMTARTTA